MNEVTFTQKVEKYYDYLTIEYGFKVTKANNSEIRPQTDGMVEYTSNTTVIVVDSETGNAAVRFYRIKDGKNHYLNPVAIHEYQSTSSDDKKLLLSTSPSDATTATSLFNKTFLLNQPGWISSGTTQEKLETRLANYATWLKQHDNLCLKDDFSKWPEFYEYKINRARADHLRLGKDEMGYVPVQDSDGSWKPVKQSIFQENLEYVEKLKKEFSK